MVNVLKLFCIQYFSNLKGKSYEKKHNENAPCVDDRARADLGVHAVDLG